MNYETIDDLNKDIKTLIPKLPTDLDLIVGVPRSGLLAANLLALYLDLPFTDAAGLCEKRILKTGRRFKEAFDFREIRKVLIIDDSIDLGTQMQEITAMVERANLEYKIYYAAVYAAPKSRDRVDFYSKLVDHPRCFEWNIMHHAFLERSCIDLDGLLCKDPTNDENDDGQNYRHFLINVEPLFRPSVEIGWIVTCRLEKYRNLTEEWLRKHSIKYKNLIMMNLPDKATRVALGNHALFKEQVYKSTDAILFIESSLDQALKIARISGKDVLCTEVNRIIEGRTIQANPSAETPSEEHADTRAIPKERKEYEETVAFYKSLAVTPVGIPKEKVPRQASASMTDAELVAFYSEKYADVDVAEFLTKERRERLYGLCNLLKPGEFYLDVGCANGAHMEILHQRGINGIGLDLSIPNILRGRQKYPHLKFIHGFAEAIPFKDNHFEIIILGDVIEHFRNPKISLSECLRVARKGIGLCVPIDGEVTAEHISPFSYEKTRELLKFYKLDWHFFDFDGREMAKARGTTKLETFPWVFIRAEKTGGTEAVLRKVIAAEQ